MDGKKYADVLNNCFTYGTLAVSIKLAKEVGVLDVLYESTVPLTSQEISDRRALKERYVRELLGALVTAGLVQVDPTSTRFHIEPEFKDVLKGKGIIVGFVSHFGQKFNAVKECFMKDGPAVIRYSDYSGFFEMLDEMRTLTNKQFIDEHLLPSTPGLLQKLETGIDVAEVGFGNGALIVTLSERFPNSRFTGSDIVEAGIEIARQRAVERKLTNIDFCLLDLCDLPENPEKKYDWIYCRDVIHDLPHPGKALDGVNQLLKPGGYFTDIEHSQEKTIAENVNRMDVSALYTCGTFLCLPESYQHPDSAALGPCWLKSTARSLFAQAGLKVINERVGPVDKSEWAFACQKTK